MKKSKVIVAGHICMDCTPLFQPGTYNRVDEILTPGKLIKVGTAEFHTGGTVANTGLAMKFFGADVSLVGKIGNDAFGKMILSTLQNYHAEKQMIIDSKSSTSYSIVLAIPGIDRIFLHNPGANDSFCESDIDYNACKEAILFHFGYPPLMAQMYRQDGDELAKIFQKVKACGCLTSLDLASVNESSEAGQADWCKILRRTLPNVDFFLPSFEELCFMLDREKYRALQKKAAGRDITEVLSVEQDVQPLAEMLLSMGCKVAIIKCGVMGLYYCTASRRAFEPLEMTSGIDFSSFSDKRGLEQSYVPDAVVSGTGAGDTTIAAFLTAITNGYPLEMCLHLAAATGACCVSAVDALSGLKDFEDLNARINAGWPKVQSIRKT